MMPLFLRLFRRLSVGALCFFIVMALVGCADTPPSQNRDVNAFGSISFSINWDNAVDSNAVSTRFACGSGSDEVAFVDAQLVNDEHAIPLAEPWPCADGRGTISQVPVGSGYTLTISAYGGDEVALYCVERIGLSVQAGATTAIGVLNAYPFETHISAPVHNASEVSAASPNFSWDELAGAAHYRLIVSESADLSHPVHAATHDSTNLTLADNVLQPGTQYWWAVVPVDFDGRTGPMPIDGSYRFTTLPGDVPPSDDAYEENDTLVDAFDLTGNEGAPLSSLNGLGIVNANDSADYFQINLNADVVWFYVDCIHTYADGDIDIALLSSDGALLVEGVSANDNESISFDLSAYAGGAYYLRVALVDESNANSYDLQFDFSECPNGDDYGDKVDTAVAISTNGTVQGAIECGDDTDYFRFELSRSRAVRIYTEGSTDTIGWLLDSGGTEIDSNDDPDDTNRNFLIQQTLPAGTYYVAVGSFESETGAYELTVLSEPSPPVISGVYDDLVDPFADYCVNSQGETFSGFNYNIYFTYDDPDGDAADGDGAYVTVNGVDWNWTSIGGDGSNGTVTISYCNSTAGRSLAITMTDGAGRVSNQLSIDLTDYP